MGSREKFLITHTSEYVLSENECVVHFDLSADPKKTDLKEYQTLAPKINEYYPGDGTNLAGGQVIVGKGEPSSVKKRVTE